MAQVVAQNAYTLENSTHLTRPDFKAFLRPDTNAGGSSMSEYYKRENDRKLHVPNLTGAPDFSTHTHVPSHENAPGQIQKAKPNDLNTLDTISSFISPSGEYLIASGQIHMKSFGKSKIEPHTIVPQDINSIRNHPEAIDELRREISGKEDPQLKWNSRKVLDGTLRARLGGWTSEKRSKTEIDLSTHKIEDLFPNMKNRFTFDRETREALAKKYIYTSSTQKAYEEIHWDSKLPSRLHAPITTYENGKADALKTNEDLYKRPQIWQNTVGQVWDRAQDRKPNYSRSAVQYTNPTKVGHQIPGYSGHIGGENMEYKDDVIEKFVPRTVIRTHQPREPEPNFKPNIPGYTGQQHNFKTTSVSHYDKDGRPYTTYAAYHRELPLNMQQKIESLTGDFTRIVTRVPPENPFNYISKPTDAEVNHSLDHVKHSIIIAKPSNDPTYHATRREKELKAKEVTFAV